MVWLHGGGFQTGSAIEQRVYDGTNLSRKGDVVVVSINHRLNVLGFWIYPPMEKSTNTLVMWALWIWSLP